MLEKDDIAAGAAAHAFNKKRAGILKRILGSKRNELAFDVYQRIVKGCEKKRHVVTPYMNVFQFKSNPYEMLNKTSLVKIGCSYPDLILACIEATDEVLNDWVEREKNG